MKKITLFWEWINYNEYTLRNLRKEPAKIQKAFVFWLEKHLHYYCDGLDCITLFPEKQSEPTQLVITANGNPKYFNQVTTLIQHAPLIPWWTFKAFIEPTTNLDEFKKGIDKPFVFKDIILKTSELKFMPYEYSTRKKIDMIVYLKDFTAHCNNKNLLQVVFIIMQDLIGEKSMYENINFVELAQMPADDLPELIYLYDLEHYLQSIERDENNHVKTANP